MATQPSPSLPTRRKKTAVERRQQHARAHARITDHLLSAATMLSQHRGSRPGKLIAALAQVLEKQTKQAEPSRSVPICRHFAKGFCWYGDRCKFKHPHLDVVASSVHHDHAGGSSAPVHCPGGDNVQGQHGGSLNTPFNIAFSDGVYVPPISMGCSGSANVAEVAAASQDIARYDWTQTPNTVDVNVLLPANVHKDNLICVIDKQRISATHTDGTVLFSAELAHPIIVRDSKWCLLVDDRNRTLQFTLEKLKAKLLWQSLAPVRARQVSFSVDPCDDFEVPAPPLDHLLASRSDDDISEICSNDSAHVDAHAPALSAESVASCSSVDAHLNVDDLVIPNASMVVDSPPACGINPTRANSDGEQSEEDSASTQVFSLDRAAKERDPLFLKCVVLFLDGASFRGRVVDIVVDQSSGEQLYEVIFEDGDLAHYTGDELETLSVVPIQT